MQITRVDLLKIIGIGMTLTSYLISAVAGWGYVIETDGKWLTEPSDTYYTLSYRAKSPDFEPLVVGDNGSFGSEDLFYWIFFTFIVGLMVNVFAKSIDSVIEKYGKNVIFGN